MAVRLSDVAGLADVSVQAVSDVRVSFELVERESTSGLRTARQA